MQYINALAQENEKKNMWIGSLMREVQAQAQVLQRHHEGQLILAEVMKQLMSQQPQEAGQGVTGTRVTVTEVDEEGGTNQDFQGGPSPHATPPNPGPFGMVSQVPHVPDHMEMVEMH